MCKIPDCLDTILDQDICHILRLVLRQCEDRNLNILLSEEEWEITDHLDLNSTDRDALQYRIDIKNPFQLKTTFFKVNVIGETRLGNLISRLIQDQRNEEILLASTDSKRREQLYKEYNI